MLQNSAPLASTNYIDNLLLANATTYTVTAVNSLAQSSPPRTVTVYPVTLGLQVNPPGQRILVNYFDQYLAEVTNMSSAASLPLAQVMLTRSVSGVSPLLATQAVQTSVIAGAYAGASMVVPEAAATAPQTVQLTAFQQTDSQGSSVIYQGTFAFTNVALPGVEIAVSSSQQPLAGGLAVFQAQIDNPSTLPIDFVVSRADGAQPGDLYLSVQNSFGQEVSRTAYLGSIPGETFLPDGRVYVQINPGASLSITVSNVLVPAALGGTTNVVFQAVVTNLYCGIGTANEVSSGPLSGSMISPSLLEPPYYGTAKTDQATYDNNQPVTITGQALSTATGQPVPNAPLTIGFASRGYVWHETVTTDTNGNYTYPYSPLPGFGGTLSLWAANPEVVDQLNQAQVVVYRVFSSPSAGDIEMSKNGTASFNLQLVNPCNVPLTGFSVSCAAYQVAGTNLTPISTVTGTNATASGFTIGANQSQTVTLALAAAMDAPSTAEAVFTFTSAEGAVATMTMTINLLPAVPVINVVQPATGYVETDVNQGQQVSSQITIVNSGLTTLQGITIAAPTNVAWMQLNLPITTNGQLTLPDLPEGQSNTFSVVYTPPAATPIAEYQDYLLIQATNLAQPYRINLYAIVTGDQDGAVQFEVQDFLADYLSGATVRLQNNLLQTSAGPFTTDTNGLVTITNLAEGVWAWQVSAPGCSAASGTVTIQADQTAFQNPILSRSLVTINFSVVPVPFTDQYEIQVSQTYSTFAPVPELVMNPAFNTFNNVTPGFQANFDVTAQNPGLLQLNDISIQSGQDSQATLTPLVTFLPVLLPQQSVQIPYVATYGASSTPGHQDLGDSLADCIPSGTDPATVDQGFSDAVNSLSSGSGDCPITGATLNVIANVEANYASGAGDTFSADSGDAADIASCVIDELLAYQGYGDLGGGGGGDSGGGGGGDTFSSGDSSSTGGDGCFVGDTAVLLASGASKPISEIKANDTVRSGPCAGNAAVVRAVCTHDADQIEEIKLTGFPTTVRATPEHFFWVDGKGWRSGAELRAGDWLYDASERRWQISKITMSAAKSRVYTLKLSGADSFYANNLLVHDLCGQPPVAQVVKTEVAR